MKKMDINLFILSLKKELENYEYYQLSYAPESEKTFSEWFDSFCSFSGFSGDEVEEEYNEEYDDEVYYGQDSQYEDLVNRRKYRSFRDDDRY